MRFNNPRTSTFRWGSLLILIFVSGCGAWAGSGGTPRAPVGTAVPLSQFVLGRWILVESIDPKGRPYDDQGWDELWFVDQSTLQLAIFDQSGSIVDAGSGRYQFRDRDSIAVQFPRLRDEQIWDLEVLGKDLVVHVQTVNGPNRLLYRRIE